MTTIYVTHDQIEAMTLADRVVVMKQGVVQQVGSPTDIYDTPANAFVASFIGNPAMNLIEGELSGGVFRRPTPRFRADAPDGKVTLGLPGRRCRVVEAAARSMHRSIRRSFWATRQWCRSGSPAHWYR